MQLDHREIMLLHTLIDQRIEWLKNKAYQYGDHPGMVYAVQLWEAQIMELHVLSKKLEAERLQERAS